MTELPPIGLLTIGEVSGEAAAWVNNWDIMCDVARAPWVALADQSIKTYEIGDDNDNSTVYVNDIQNDILAIVDIQCKEPPVSELEPSETGDEPDVYWIGPPDVAMQLGIMPVYVEGAMDPMTGQMVPAPPMPAMLVQQIEQFPGAEKWLARVSSETTAEFYQTHFDKTWDRSRLNQWFRGNVLDTNIAGWQFALYEYDPAERRVYMTPLSVHQAFIDPTVQSLDRASGAGCDILVDIGWAKHRYPDVAEIIEQEARTGNPTQYGSVTTTPELDAINFANRMVKMRLRWYRNQPVAEPMTPDEALSEGRVVMGQREVVNAEPISTEVSQPTGGIQDSSVDSNIAAVEQPPAPPQLQSFLAHPTTGEELAHGAPGWPHKAGRLALRRIVFINNVLVDDEIEQAWDIPLVHNISIPIPRKPFGIGEPYRLLPMQQARNKMLKAMVDHCAYNSHPTRAMSESMYAVTVSAKQKMNEPGGILIVPDHQYNAMNGKIETIQPLPDLPSYMVEAQAIFKQEITDSSGHADVLQGKAQPNVKSGRAIELLQSAAETSATGVKTMFASDMLWRLDQLLLHDLVRYMTVQDVLKISKRNPPHVIQAYLDRGKDIEWMVNVSIGGGGSLTQMKRQKALNDLQLGAISMETYRDKNDIDHKQEQQRMESQMHEQAELMAGLPQPAQAAGGEKPASGSGNGNGQHGGRFKQGV